MKTLPFAKVEAVGNNFVLVDGTSRLDIDWSVLAKSICTSHFGVGSDGLLVFLPSKEADFKMRMFNPDGTEDVCGNGVRCAATYAHYSHRNIRREMSIEMNSRRYYTEIIDFNCNSAIVRTNMGQPSFLASDLPANLDVNKIIDHPLAVGKETYNVTCLSMGTPHAVIFAPLDSFWECMPEVSSEIEIHSAFPEKINVDWCCVESMDSIRMRTWERAVGPTLGCGTGASSVMVAASIRGLVGSRASVISPGGTIEVEWPDKGDVYISGPTKVLYEGEWPLAWI